MLAFELRMMFRFETAYVLEREFLLRGDVFARSEAVEGWLNVLDICEGAKEISEGFASRRSWWNEDLPREAEGVFCQLLLVRPIRYTA